MKFIKKDRTKVYQHSSHKNSSVILEPSAKNSYYDNPYHINQPQRCKGSNPESQSQNSKN